MGRRTYKKVIINGSTTLHQRYVYRGYLQIACVDLTRSHHPALWYYTMGRRTFKKVTELVKISGERGVAVVGAAKS